jgi:hypothetical protein
MKPISRYTDSREAIEDCIFGNDNFSEEVEGKRYKITVEEVEAAAEPKEVPPTNRYKFNLERALAGDKVVHSDGRISFRVEYDVEKDPNYQLTVFWGKEDNGDSNDYTTDGKIWASVKDPILFMLQPDPVAQ